MTYVRSNTSESIMVVFSIWKFNSKYMGSAYWYCATSQIVEKFLNFSIVVLTIFSLWLKGILADFYSPPNSPGLIIYKKYCLISIPKSKRSLNLLVYLGFKKQVTSWWMSIDTELKHSRENIHYELYTIH